MTAEHEKAGVLATLREANRVRQAEWCAGGDPEPDLSFRAVELAGEVGEACNVVKKLERERHGWRGSRATVDQLAEELADVVICADLLAMTAGIDLEAAVIAKFNATSEKVGLATRLGRPLTIKEDAAARSIEPGKDEERLREAAESAAIDLECIATAIRHGFEAQAAVDADMSAARLRAALSPSRGEADTSQDRAAAIPTIADPVKESGR